jgi:carbamoylphosphate synthase large subunit
MTTSHTAPRVLVASTTSWEFPARAATAFQQIGWHVEVVCMPGSTLEHARAVRATHRYHPLRPLAALAAAVRRSNPDLVVPCDDRALAHLLDLNRQALQDGAADLADTITRSVGDPARCAAVAGRADFIALARREGIRAPLTLAVAGPDSLKAAIEQTGLPAVLKVDGTWGGIGVTVAETLPAAERIFARMSRRPSGLRAAKRLVVNHDAFGVLPWLRRQPRQVNVQAFVRGRPANCLFSCKDGEVLAIIQVEVEAAEHAMGPSAIVRVVDRPDMVEAAQRIAASLQLSGFAGLDFLIDDTTDEAHLIEMNQRMTPVGHLALGRGRDPIGALAARLTGSARTVRPAVTDQDMVALFPAAWQVDPPSPLLANAYADIPWSDPALARAMLLPPWDERGLLARIIDSQVGTPTRPADLPALAAIAGDLLAAPRARPADAAWVSSSHALREKEG